MRYHKMLLLIAVMLIPVMLHTAPVTAEGSDPVKFVTSDPNSDANNTYFIRIEAQQWEYKAFDLVKIYQDAGKEFDGSQHEIDFLTESQQASYEIKHRIGSFEPGAKVVFQLFSRDVQHGFSINELGIAEALNRPTPGDEFGTVITTKAVTLPNSDTTLSAFCHIFCGLGHPDMKLKLIIGEGAFEVGPIVFYAAVAINLGIFGLYLRSIVTKVKLLPEPVTA